VKRLIVGILRSWHCLGYLLCCWLFVDVFLSDCSQVQYSSVWNLVWRFRNFLAVVGSWFHSNVENNDTGLFWVYQTTSDVSVSDGRICEFIINKYQPAVDQFWLNDRQTDAISDWPTVDHVQHFAATSFSLLQQLCTVDNGIFIWPMWTSFLLLN